VVKLPKQAGAPPSAEAAPTKAPAKAPAKPRARRAKTEQAAE
jgi:hypothetical protein